MKKKFRWFSFPGVLLMLIGCAIITDSDDDDDDDKAVAPVPVQYVVTADVLNFRDGPSIKSEVVLQADRGTLVVPVHMSGSWLGVRLTDGSVVWASRDFLEVKR
jgi:uncharacterized protein YgiM (DUF1202 family)